MSRFSIDAFAQRCKSAMAASSDPQQAASALLRETLAQCDTADIMSTLDGAIPPGADIGEMIVHSSPELTMLYARLPPRFKSGIHNHTVFACIGLLQGDERNLFYERTPDGTGLKLVKDVTGQPGEVLMLRADVIHSIENPDETPSSALHLYGGDFRAIQDQRSLWTTEGHEEIDFSFEALLRESAKAMRQDGNAVGLDALKKAVPAAEAMVDAL